MDNDSVEIFELGDTIRLTQDLPEGAFRNEPGVVTDVDPVTLECAVVLQKHMMSVTVHPSVLARRRTRD